MKNPFRGVEAYTRKDRDVLFGREEELALLLGRVLSRRTTLLFSASGVGKTSFLNAKLIPELEERYVVCYHRDWAGALPVEGLLARLAKDFAASPWQRAAAPAPSSGSLLEAVRAIGPNPGSAAVDVMEPDGVALILDQFEEVLQHYGGTNDLRRLVEELKALAGDPHLEIRIVFSMREDFLGELTVFDNYLPDLFNNYYRLRNPTRGQAREIIRETAGSEGIPDSPALENLLDDLEAAAGSDPHRAGVRDQVFPPYLQIACHELWESAPPSPETGFPRDYHSGDAVTKLKEYCLRHLNSLAPDDQAVVSDALGFLITKRGAKMAYDLASLAEHMGREESAVAHALETLSAPQVRILRRTPAPGGGLWFELYHDIYAPFLTAWNESYKAELKRRDRERAELAQCATEAAQEETRAQRRRWRRRALAAAVPVAIVLAVLSVLMVRGKDRLKSAERATALLTSAQQQIEMDSQRAILLALYSMTLAGDVRPAGTYEQVLNAAIKMPRLRYRTTPAGPLADLSYSPGGDMALLLIDGRALIGFPFGQPQFRPAGLRDPVRMMALCAAAPLALVATDRSLRLYANTGERLEPITPGLQAPGGFRSPWTALACGPGVLLAGFENGALVNWRITERQRPAVIAAVRQTSGIKRIVLHPQGKSFVVVADDGTAAAYRLPLQLVRRFLPGSHVRTVAFDPARGNLLTGDTSGRVTVFDGNDGRLLAVVGGTQGPINDLTVSRDGTRFAAASDGTVQLWDVPRDLTDLQHSRAVPLRQARDVRRVVLDGGMLFTVGGDGTVAAWEFQPRLLDIGAGAGIGVSAALDPSGRRIAATAADRSITVFETRSAALLYTLKAPRAGLEMWEVAYGPDDKIAAVDLGGILRVWQHGKPFLEKQFPRTLWSVDISPDGSKIAVADADGSVSLLSGGQVFEARQAHREKAVCVRFAPDGRRLASSSWDRRILLYDLPAEGFKKAGPLRKTKEFQAAGGVVGLSFNRSGTLLAAADWAGSVRVWNCLTSQPVAVLNGHVGPVTGVAFDPQADDRLASCGGDGTVRLWDVTTGQELLRFAEHQGSAFRVLFSPSGRRLYSTGADGLIRAYVPSLDQLVELANKYKQRGFTRDECRIFLAGLPCPAGK